MTRKLTETEKSKVRLIGLALQRMLDVFELMHNLIFRQKHKNLAFHPRFQSLIRHKEAAAKHFFEMREDIEKLLEEDSFVPESKKRPSSKKKGR